MSVADSPLTAALDMLADVIARRVVDELRPLLTSAREPSPAVPALLDKQALAHALDKSTASIDRLVRDGAIPFVRVGDVRRFDLAAVLAALQVVPATTEKPQPARTRSSPPTTGLAGVHLLTRSRR